MSTQNESLIALCAKRVNELHVAFAKLARQPGPQGALGPAGSAGRDGKDGKDGKDGERGAQGARGKDGERGAQGVRGKDGERGPAGPPGKDGKDGARGPAPKHEWQGTKLRFEKPEGGWGALVDLRGPKGETGSRGASGGGGGRAVATAPFDIDSLPAATGAIPSEFLVQQGGQWVRASYAQMQAWFPSVAPTGVVTVGGEPVTVNAEYVKVT